MADRCDIPVVIPVFNEAENLRTRLDRLQSLKLPSSEVVVDDGSTDGSEEIAEKKGVKVIRHPYNVGNGATIKSGIRVARGRLLVLNTFSYPSTLTLAFFRSGLTVKYVPIHVRQEH